ncbi:hypothetical protein LEMLEM_LOCUS24376 [Lemmus lemmus]
MRRGSPHLAPILSLSANLLSVIHHHSNCLRRLCPSLTEP